MFDNIIFIFWRVRNEKSSQDTRSGRYDGDGFVHSGIL